MLQIVNGYVCRSGCDVAAARRGADPRNPTGDPTRQELLDRADPAKIADRVSREADAGYGGAEGRVEASGLSVPGLPQFGRFLDIRV